MPNAPSRPGLHVHFQHQAEKFVQRKRGLDICPDFKEWFDSYAGSVCVHDFSVWQEENDVFFEAISNANLPHQETRHII